MLKLNEIIAIIPESDIDGNTFVTRQYFQKCVLKILFTIGRGLLFSRL